MSKLGEDIEVVLWLTVLGIIEILWIAYLIKGIEWVTGI